MQLTACDGVEALGRLLITLGQLGAQRAGPIANRICGEPLVDATVLLHPDLEFSLGFENAN